jgi:Sensors of blue-light using FAD
MVLVRLIYASSLVGDLTKADLEQIVTRASENNGKLNVTGVLGFSQSFFLQCLEGSRSSVNSVYRKILNDERHSDVEILSYDEISERDFPAWNMTYIAEVKINRHINVKYSNSPDFTPHKMSGLSAYKMLKELALGLPN